MKRAEKILRVLDDISQLYWEDGYVVKEFSVPNEWKDALDIPDEGATYTNFVNVKLFSNQSRHLLVVVEPAKEEQDGG